MSSALGEAWLLDTSTPVRTRRQPFAASVTSFSSSKFRKGKQKADTREITVCTVQGVGIHLKETSKRTTLEKHSLGPSVRFTAPSITRLLYQKEANEGTSALHEKIWRTTFAAVQENDADHFIYRWTAEETADGIVQGEEALLKHPVSVPVVGLAAPADSRYLFYATQGGHLVCLDDNLTMVARLETRKNDAPLMRYTRVVTTKASSTAFLPASASTDNNHIICLLHLDSERSQRAYQPVRKTKTKAQTPGSSTHLASLEVISAVWNVDAPKLNLLADLRLPVQDVIDVSIDETGLISALTGRNELLMFRLLQVDTTGQLTLEQCRRIALSSTDVVPRGAAISQINTSAVLIALYESSSSGGGDDIRILLIEVRLGIVVASQRIKLSEAVTAGRPKLRLDSTSETHAFLTVLPEEGAIHIFAIPHTGWTRASLADALRNETDDVRYLAHASCDISTMLRNPLMSDVRWQHLLDERSTRKQSVEQILAALSERRDIHRAEDIYDRWLATEMARSSKFVENMRLQRPIPNQSADGTAEFHSASKSAKGAKEHRGSIVSPLQPFDPQCAQHLQPSLPAYDAGMIIDKLLDASTVDDRQLPQDARFLKKILSASPLSAHDLPRDLLSRILQRHDWSSIEAIIQYVTDLSESDLVRVLAAYVTPDPSANASRGLDYWMARLAAYPTSKALLCQAIHNFLSPAHLRPILDVLLSWLRQWADNMTLLISKESVPSLPHTLDLAQSILDAHFVALLSDTQLHEPMMAVTTSLRELTASSSDLQTLRGPLTPFTKLKQVQARTARLVPKTSTAERRRHERTESVTDDLAGGLYVIEEFDL